MPTTDLEKAYARLKSAQINLEVAMKNMEAAELARAKASDAERLASGKLACARHDYNKLRIAQLQK